MLSFINQCAKHRPRLNSSLKEVSVKGGVQERSRVFMSASSLTVLLPSWVICLKYLGRVLLSVFLALFSAAVKTSAAMRENFGA